tara:strand:- start:581 stop:1921 length:1341 start_codon:yes stop_codon:yes gene_type:complete
MADVSYLAKSIGTGGDFQKKLEAILKDQNTAEIPTNKAYDLERSSPTGILKQMIRERHTPQTINQKPVATAQILRIENDLQSYYDATNPDQDTETKYVLARFRVLSDRRHHWLPEPKSFNEDDIISLYPLAKYAVVAGMDQMLNPGDIVQVTFENHADQYSSYYETATISTNIGNIGQVDSLTANKKCANVKLPPLPADANPDNLATDPCLAIGNVAGQNVYNAKKEAQQNKKQIIIPRFPVTSGYSKMSNWGQIRRRSDGSTRRHWGVDYDLKMNDVVQAALDGVVIRATTQYGKDDQGQRTDRIVGYGNYVVLKHSIYSKTLNGPPVIFYTLYAHFGDNSGSNNGFMVRKGQKVKRGQPIGKGGNSGTSRSGPGGDGSHLHFEFLDNPNFGAAITPALKKKNSKDPETEFFRRGFYIDTPQAAKEKRDKTTKEQAHDAYDGAGP